MWRGCLWERVGREESVVRQSSASMIWCVEGLGSFRPIRHTSRPHRHPTVSQSVGKWGKRNKGQTQERLQTYFWLQDRTNSSFPNRKRAETTSLSVSSNFLLSPFSSSCFLLLLFLQ